MTLPAAVLSDLAPTGTLRASINLGNPVLAQGSATEPRGVTVDLSHELAARLGVPVTFLCFDAARKSFEALSTGAADVGFLAIEPARAAQVAFTPPYVLIEGVYVVADDSPIATAADVDRPGVRVAVNEGSAYDLYLTRTLEHAELIRGDVATDLLHQQGLDAVAGVRQPMTRYVAEHRGLHVIEPRFMEIRQAVATGKDRTAETVGYLSDVVEELKAIGFVAESLVRSGQDASVAPPA